VKPYRLHRKAEEEYARAAEYYAGINPTLGQRFYTEMESLIADICARPTLWRVAMSGVWGVGSPRAASIC